MGAGLALQAKRRYPQLPEKAGAAIKYLADGKQFSKYGLIRIKVSHHVEIALLQTKTDWRLPSSPELILTSLAKLKFVIESNDIKSVAMPLPGAGKGGLSKARSIALVNQALADVGDRILLCDF